MKSYVKTNKLLNGVKGLLDDPEILKSLGEDVAASYDFRHIANGTESKYLYVEKTNDKRVDLGDMYNIWKGHGDIVIDLIGDKRCQEIGGGYYNNITLPVLMPLTKFLSLSGDNVTKYTYVMFRLGHFIVRHKMEDVNVMACLFNIIYKEGLSACDNIDNRTYESFLYALLYSEFGYNNVDFIIRNNGEMFKEFVKYWAKRSLI